MNEKLMEGLSIIVLLVVSLVLGLSVNYEDNITGFSIANFENTYMANDSININTDFKFNCFDMNNTKILVEFNNNTEIYHIEELEHSAVYDKTYVLNIKVKLDNPEQIGEYLLKIKATSDNETHNLEKKILIMNKTNLIEIEKEASNSTDIETNETNVVEINETEKKTDIENVINETQISNQTEAHNDLATDDTMHQDNNETGNITIRINQSQTNTEGNEHMDDAFNETNITKNIKQTQKYETFTLQSKEGKDIGVFEISAKDSKYNLKIYEVAKNSTIQAEATIKGMKDIPIVKTKIGRINEKHIKTKVFAIEHIKIQEAEIILPKTGYVDTIYRCNNFDIDIFECEEEWQKTNIEFEDLENRIKFTVDHFSAYAGGIGYDSRLYIYDDTDFEIKQVEENILFYANYTNSSNQTILDSNCTIEFNITGNWEGLSNMHYNESLELWFFNRSFNASGENQFNVSCTSSYDNLSAIDSITIYNDHSGPYWTENKTNFEGVSTYEKDKEYMFNVTWNDANDINEVIIEHDFNSSVHNYSVNNIGNEYYYTYTGLKTGTYNWKEYAYDILGNLNSTDEWQFEIVKAEPVLNLTLNRIQGNVLVNENQNLNINAYCQEPHNEYVELYLNDSLINKGTGILSNTTSFANAGLHNSTIRYLGNENYTSANITYNISVNSQPYIDPAVPNVSIYRDYGDYEINLTHYENDLEDSAENLSWSIGYINNSLLQYIFNEDVLTLTTVSAAHGVDKLELILTDSNGLNDTQNITVFIPSIELHSEIGELFIIVNNTNSTSIILNVTDYYADVNLTVNNSKCSLDNYSLVNFIGKKDINLSCNFNYSQNISEYVLIDTNKSNNLTIKITPVEPRFNLEQISGYNIVSGGSFDNSIMLNVSYVFALDVNNTIDCPNNWGCNVSPEHYAKLEIGNYGINYSIIVPDDESAGNYRINYSTYDQYGRKEDNLFYVNVSQTPFIFVEKNNLSAYVDICEDIEYNIYFENNDLVNLDNITIIDYLPSDLEFNSWSTENNRTIVDMYNTNSRIVWNKSSMEIGENISISLNLTANCSAYGYNINKANITYYWNTTSGARRNKTTEIEAHRVYVNKPKIELEIVPDQTLKNLNQTITWTLRIRNTGNATAYNINISYLTEQGFEYISFSDMSNISNSKPGYGVDNNHSILWIANITKGDEWTAEVYANPKYCDENLLDSNLSVKDICGCDEFDKHLESNISLRKIIINKTTKKTELGIGELNTYTIEALVCGEYKNLTITDSFPNLLNFTKNDSYVDDNDINITTIKTDRNFRWTLKNHTGNMKSLEKYVHIRLNISQYPNNLSNDNDEITNNATLLYYNSSEDESDKFYETGTSAGETSISQSTITVYEPDVQISVETLKDTWNISDELHVNITLVNIGNNDAYNLTINSSYVDGLELINSSYEMDYNDTELFSWKIGKLEQAQQFSIIVNYLVNETYKDARRVLADDYLGIDADIEYYSYYLDNEHNAVPREYYDQDNKQIKIDRAYLNFDTDKIVAAIGEKITYDITADFSKVYANDAHIINKIPFGTEFIRYTNSSYMDLTVDMNRLIFNLTNITERKKINLSIEVYVNSSAYDGQNLINYVNLTYQNSTDDEFVIQHSSTVTVREPFIDIIKELMSSQEIKIGDVVEYNITIINNGLYDGYNVTMQENISDGLILNSSSPAYDSKNGNILVWHYSKFQKQTTKNILLNLTVNRTYKSGEYVSANDVFNNHVDINYYGFNSTIAEEYNATVNAYYNETYSDNKVELIKPRIYVFRDKTNATIGENVSYNIVLNFTETAGNYVELNNTLDQGFVLINATNNPSYNGRNLLWSFGNISLQRIEINYSVYINDTSINEKGRNVEQKFDLKYESHNLTKHYLNNKTYIEIKEPNVTIFKQLMSDPNSGIGEVIEYNITIVNRGNSDAFNVTIKDRIPNGTYYNTSNPGFVKEENKYLLWNYSRLDAGDYRTILLNFTINNSYDDRSIVNSGDIFGNSVNMTYYSYNYTLANPYKGKTRKYYIGTNSDAFVIISPEFGKITSPLKTIAGIGENINYVINVNYTAGANNVTVNDLLPDNIVLVNYSFEDNATTDNKTIQWNFGRVGEIRQDNINIRTYVNDSSSVYDGIEIEKNYANLTYIGENNTVYNLSSLSNTVTVREPNVNLSIVLIGNKHLKIKDNVEYKISIENIGNYAAYNVTLHDKIPDGLFYNSSNIGYKAFEDNILEYNYPKISAGTVKNILLNLTINGTYADGNLVSSNDSIYDSINTTYYSFNQTKAKEYGGIVREYFNSSYSENISLIAPTIEKYVNSSFGYEGDIIKYVIEVNASNGLRNFTVEDNLPEGLTYVNDTRHIYSSLDGNNITWEFGDVPNQFTYINITVNISSSPDQGDGVYIDNNTATIYYMNSNKKVFSLNSTSSRTEMNVPPEQINLTSPVDEHNTTNRQPSFDWGDSNDLDIVDSIKYYLEISNSSCFEYLYADQNTTLSEYTLTGVQSLSDGQYYWRVKICDDSLKLNNCSYSYENFTFRVDNGAPEITIHEPDEDEVVAWLVYFIANATDNLTHTDKVWYTISNNTLMQQGFLNMSNSWEAVWNTANIVSNSTDINHFNFTVYANDTLDNTANKTIAFVVDNRNPGLQIISPDKTYHNANIGLDIRLSNEHLNKSWFEINYSSRALLISNNTEIGKPRFNWTQQIDLSIEDNYTLTVYAEDEVGNNITKQTWFVYDTSAPNHQLFRSPIPAYTTDNITLSVIVNDNYNIDTVYITHNASGTYENHSVQISGNNYSRIIYHNETSNQENIGWYTWINDSAKNVNISSIEAIKIENRVPVFSPLLSNKIAQEDQEFRYNINATDYDYEDSINYTTNATEFMINKNTGLINWTPTNEDVGVLVVNVTICDNSTAAAYCNSSVFNITVNNTNDAPYAVSLGLPENNSITNDPNPYFNWSVANDVDAGDSLTYYLILDNNSDFSSVELIQNTTNNLYGLTNSQNLSNDQWYWRVRTCDDSYSTNNCTYSAENFTFTIDESTSIVTLTEPIDGHNATKNNMTFICNVTDNYGLKNITLFANITGWNKFGSTNISGKKNSSVFVVTNISDGSYVWNCLAYDMAGNYNWALSNNTFRIDTNAPNITYYYPSNGASLGYTTTKVEAEIRTDELSVCWYNFTNKSFVYSQGNNFNDSYRYNHSLNISISQGQSYSIYYLCNDSYGNLNNESYVHSFSVQTQPDDPSGGGEEEPPAEPECTASWECTAWSPAICPPSGIQTRSCTCSCPGGTGCTGDYSTSRTCVYTPTCDDGIKNQDETDVDCGGSCLGCSTGKQCSQQTDCLSGLCVSNVCREVGCFNNIKDGDETDIDCGGSCSKCAVNKACSSKSDCLSNLCINNICKNPSCTDSLKNQDETDIDCGGNICSGCAVDKNCNANSDCQSNYCIGGKCKIASCSDGLMNQDETDVDCGGSICGKCSIGKECLIDPDCINNNCVLGQCVEVSCDDGIQNGDETDVDCGGVCGKCRIGSSCALDSDCENNNCLSNVCAAENCDDNIKNGDETDVDCGGSCPRCDTGKSCSVNSDCSSNSCIDNICGAPNCEDNSKNQDETDVDCGGSCYACEDGKQCSVNSDCASLFCKENVCRQASCTDTIINQDETDVDCGGPCQGCTAGKNCMVDSDCISKYCVAGMCETASCTDGVLNGDEEGIDCGGSCPACASCDDGIKNGDEKGIDCGGSCPACFLECSDGTQAGKCSVEKPKYCTLDEALVFDCENCGCPNTGDVCQADGKCRGIGSCSDRIQNQGETGVDCGGPCKACEATCFDGLKNQGETGVDCGGPCEPCAKEPLLEKPGQFEFDEIQSYEFMLYENDMQEFEIDNIKHTVHVSKVYLDSADLIISSDPIKVNVKLGKESYVDIDGDNIYDIRLLIKDIADKGISLKITVLEERITAAQRIRQLLGLEERESSIIPQDINIDNMPCLKDPKSSQNKISVFGSDFKFDTPIGYDVLIDGFNIMCNNGATNLTLTIPKNYADIFALDKNGNRIKLASTGLKCGEEFEEFAKDEMFVREYEDFEVAGNIDENNKNINHEYYDFEFITDDKFKVVLKKPKDPVLEPKNNLLKISGKAIALHIDKKIVSGNLKIALPLVKDEKIEEGSYNVYVMVPGQQWKLLESDEYEKIISSRLNNLSSYINRNNEIVLAVIGKICANCKYSTLKKAYDPGNTRDALLMIHGLGSSPKTFENVLKDIRMTNQPWQAWTYGYPTEKSVSKNAIELAHHLEANADEFDYMYIAAHSMGGLVVREALYYSYLVNKEKPGTFKYLDKIKKVILISVPNKGSPGAEFLLGLSQYLTNDKSDTAIVNLDSKGVQDLINGTETPMVSGIKYYVIAGTKSYEFGKSILRVELFEQNVTNDGLVSVDSAQKVGGAVLDDECENYWEIYETHTEILDNPISRRLVEKIVAEEIAKGIKNTAILGNIVYYDLPIKCGEDYVVLGKKVNPNKQYDPTGCLCGNGYCGEGEDKENCAIDCDTLLNKENICKSSPFAILLLIVVMLIIGAPYVYEKYIRRLRFATVLKNRMVCCFVWTAYIIAAVNLMLFLYYKQFCISYYSVGLGKNMLIALGMLIVVLLIYDWFIYKFRKEEKKLEKEFKFMSNIARLFRLHVKLMLWIVWILIVIGYAAGMMVVFNISEELFANLLFNVILVILTFVAVNTLNFFVYEERKIVTGLEKKEKEIEKLERFEEKEIKKEKKKIWELEFKELFKSKKEVKRLKSLEKARKARFKKLKKKERREKIRIFKIRVRKVKDRLLHKLGLKYTIKEKERLFKKERLKNLEKARRVKKRKAKIKNMNKYLNKLKNKIKRYFKKELKEVNEDYKEWYEKELRKIEREKIRRMVRAKKWYKFLRKIGLYHTKKDKQMLLDKKRLKSLEKARRVKKFNSIIKKLHKRKLKPLEKARKARKRKAELNRIKRKINKLKQKIIKSFGKIKIKPSWKTKERLAKLGLYSKRKIIEHNERVERAKIVKLMKKDKKKRKREADKEYDDLKYGEQTDWE